MAVMRVAGRGSESERRNAAPELTGHKGAALAPPP
jgi:hypothetical protein